ncbi:MAG: hypothetical protein H6Q14_919 [Bacteroidetes bacterium]|nr:hypothetical protein [Bacteroidota bacterium]
MKKKILGGIAFAAVAFIAWANVTVIENNKSVPEVSLAEVEALADGESGFWSDVWNGIKNTSQGQGWTKDEREEKIPCQSGSNTAGASASGTILVNGVPVTIGVSVGTSSPAGAYKIECPTGSDNCTPVGC